MGNWLKHFLNLALPPKADGSRWIPWVVGPNIAADAVIALCFAALAGILIVVVYRRKEPQLGYTAVTLGLFAVACACTFAVEIITTWYGAFHFAGLIKTFTAATGLAAILDEAATRQG